MHLLLLSDHNAFFTMSARGKKTLMCDGYRYRYDCHSASGKVRWRCTSHAKFGCKSAVFTIEDEIIQVKGTHTFHPVSRVE